jgi:hypothetical protein
LIRFIISARGLNAYREESQMNEEKQKIDKLMNAAYKMFSELRKTELDEEQSLKTVITAMAKKLDK